LRTQFVALAAECCSPGSGVRVASAPRRPEVNDGSLLVARSRAETATFHAREPSATTSGVAALLLRMGGESDDRAVERANVAAASVHLDTPLAASPPHERATPIAWKEQPGS